MGKALAVCIHPIAGWHRNDAVERLDQLEFAQPARLDDRLGRFHPQHHRRRLAPVASGAIPFDIECDLDLGRATGQPRSEEHTSELQSLMRISYAVFCLKKKKKTK